MHPIRVITRDAPIIGKGQLLAVLPIIGIGQLARWYQPIVIYTTGKYKFLIIESKHDDCGFRFR